jgi:hypothetical protein
MMKKHLNAPIPDPRRYAPDLPVTVYRFFQKAMAKDPEERYQTAEELIAALDRLDFSATAGDVAPTPAALSAQIGPIAFEDRGSHLSKALGRAVRRAQRHHATPSPAQYPVDQPSAQHRWLAGWKLWLLIGVGVAVVIGLAVVVAFLLTPHSGPEGVTPTPGQVPAPAPPSAGMLPPSAPPPGTVPVQPVPPEPTPPTPPPPNLEEPAQAALKAAKEFEAQPKTPPEEAIRVYKETVIGVYPGTQAAEEARQAIERLLREDVPPAPKMPSEEDAEPPLAAPETPENVPTE